MVAFVQLGFWSWGRNDLYDLERNQAQHCASLFRESSRLFERREEEFEPLEQPCVAF
jgi:alpha-tubulin suppressor-like RCC1 family protein